jgi:low affinity Fe/Cu permease
VEQRKPHPQHTRTPFDNFAERAARVTSDAPFFVISSVLIALWVPTLVLVSVEASQSFIQTVTAIVTFLLVALLQNSQHRSEQAVNLKLNAIAQGIADLMRYHNGEDSDLDDNIDRLSETVGLEERITTAPQREGGGKARKRAAGTNGQADDDEEEEEEAGAGGR